MKGKKFIVIISIVCILAVILCVPAFATVTESDGDGYALYNGVKLPVLPESHYPYAYILASDSSYCLKWGDVIRTVSADGKNWFYGGNTYELVDGIWVSSNIAGEYKVIWSNIDVYFDESAGGSLYLSSSNPVSLDGYNLIEWDGDTTGLVEVSDNFYALDNVQRFAVDAFAVMEVSYSTIPVILNDFISSPEDGWVVVGPTSAYVYSAGNLLVESIDSESYWSTFALKFDDIDDTGYTKLIAYRTVEEPPEEGGDTPDEPQPPFGAAEMYLKLHLLALIPQQK